MTSGAGGTSGCNATDTSYITYCDLLRDRDRDLEALRLRDLDRLRERLGDLLLERLFDRLLDRLLDGLLDRDLLTLPDPDLHNIWKSSLEQHKTQEKLQLQKQMLDDFPTNG